MKARTLLNEAVQTLKESAAIDHWQKGRERIEAELLLEHVLGEEPGARDAVSPGRTERFLALIARRATGEPIPYIVGTAEFRGLTLRARPGVFVPRDSSEFLAEQAVRRLRRRKAPVYVDLATGGGTIALAVANEVPHAEVWGTDISSEAVKLARKNAKHLRLAARFMTGDLFAGLPERIAGHVDVISLHPPYVARAEMRHLPDEIANWEPDHTLTDFSRDGLGLLSRAISESPAWLRPKGWLLVEVSPDRAAPAKQVFRAGGFKEVAITKGGDLKVTRVIVGRWPS